MQHSASHYFSCQVIADRERAIREIERLAQCLRDRGDVESWFPSADPQAKKVGSCFSACAAVASFDMCVQLCSNVHGPLLEKLAEVIKYHDKSCCNLFRSGGRLVRTLDRHRSVTLQCCVEPPML